MAGKQPKRKPRPGVDEYGRIPLHYAAGNGDIAMVRAQLTSGASPNAQDDNGWTPLHFAAQGRHAEIVQLLVHEHANPNLVDRHGNGPLWTAIMNSRDDFAIIKLFLAHGADATRKNVHGKCPKEMALTIGHGLETLFGE